MPITETQAGSRARVLGCPVDVIDLPTAATRLVDLVAAGGSGGEPAVVVTLNPEMVVRASRDPEFAAILERAALVVPDGVGVVGALRRRGYSAAVRVGGADLFMAYLERAAAVGHRVALCGSAPGVAAVAAQRYRQEIPGVEIVATDSGDPDRSTAQRLRDARPDLVGAAYGAGKQETFLAVFLPSIGASVGIGIGGTLDYAAGRIRRAPVWVQRHGLEWAWRLIREPKRWRRQLDLPRFWWRERREAAKLGPRAC